MQQRMQQDSSGRMSMRRLVLSCLSIVAAAAASAPSFAQAPPGTPPYGETINLAQARKAADAAMTEAAKQGWSMAIAVVGLAGDLVYFQKMDNTQYASVPIAQHKALEQPHASPA
jgi:glc operon protein GlcG